MAIKNIKINYRKLTETMFQLVQEAKTKKYKRPSYGDTTEFQINRMSMSMIIMKTNNYIISNGIFDKKENETIMDLLIQVWIKNKHKVSKCSFCYYSVSADPDGFKIFFHRHLNDWMEKSITDFYTSQQKQSNRESCYKKQEAEQYIQKIVHSEKLSQTSLNRLLQINQEIYCINCVTETDFNLSKIDKVNIIVDSEGRKICEKVYDHVSLSARVRLFNKNNFSLNVECADLYSTEDKLVSDLDNFKNHLIHDIKDREVITFLESGMYPILYHPITTSTFFHEAIAGHLLSGQYIANQESNIFSHLGKDWSTNKKFSILKGIVLSNRPNAADMLGSYHYDNEGIKSQDVVLLDKGVISNYLTDLNSAARLGLTSGGHCLAESFVQDIGNQFYPRLPEPRISNLIVETTNQKSLTDIQKEIVDYCKQNGHEFYLEVYSNSGEVNCETGIFTMILDSADIVYLDGRKKTIINGSLNGDLFQFMASICGIGGKSEDNIGHCGSNSGWIVTHGRAPWMWAKPGINYVPSAKPPTKQENYHFLEDKYIPNYYKRIEK